MISLRTTVVLGAGASVPCGYPTGLDLVTLIRANLEEVGSAKVRQLLELGHASNHIQDFVNKLRDSEYDSIDEFLRHVPLFEKIGKQAIAQVLLEKEFDDAKEPSQHPGKWYHILKAAILDETMLGGVNGSMLSVITFNYDRSLEHYLHRTITAGTAYPENDVVRVLNSFRVHHIHGILGHLPWQDARYVRKYGSSVTHESVVNSAEGIRLAHESGPRYLDSFSVDLLSNADRIIFLGFGYASSNLKKIGLSASNAFKNKRIIGTRYKFPSAKLDDQITEFPVLAEIRDIPNVDIATYITHHETLGKKVARV